MRSGLGGLSNAQGRFLIPNVPVGQHELRVEMLGYLTVSQNVNVQAGTALSLSFALEQTALAINEIVVTGVAAATPSRAGPTLGRKTATPATSPTASAPSV